MQARAKTTDRDFRQTPKHSCHIIISKNMQAPPHPSFLPYPPHFFSSNFFLFFLFADRKRSSKSTSRAPAVTNTAINSSQVKTITNAFFAVA